MAVMLACIMILVGCGNAKAEEPITVSTISISKDGHITYFMVEDFSEDYYDIKEIEEMLSEEITQFNEEHGKEEISIESVGMAEDGSQNIVIELTFLNADDFSKYIGTDIFYGTMEEAIQEGYEISDNLIDVKKKTTVSLNEITHQDSRHILILEDTLLIKLPLKVVYTSDNVTYMENGNVDTSNTEGVAYIIMK